LQSAGLDGAPGASLIKAQICSSFPKSKYAERVAAKHPVTLDKRFIHARPEREEE
jgi:hypothetical protein